MKDELSQSIRIHRQLEGICGEEQKADNIIIYLGGQWGREKVSRLEKLWIIHVIFFFQVHGTYRSEISMMISTL